MSNQEPTKFFEVEGTRVEQPVISGIETWLNLFVGLQKTYPGKQVACGWDYPDGTSMVMHKTAPKNVPVPHPSTKPRFKYDPDAEPGDRGSNYDEYLEVKHAVRNGLVR